MNKVEMKVNSNKIYSAMYTSSWNQTRFRAFEFYQAKACCLLLFAYIFVQLKKRIFHRKL